MLKVAVLFGGKSTEHDVSVVSGTSVLYNMDKINIIFIQFILMKKGNIINITKA